MYRSLQNVFYASVYSKQLRVPLSSFFCRGGQNSLLSEMPARVEFYRPSVALYCLGRDPFSLTILVLATGKVSHHSLASPGLITVASGTADWGC